MFEEFGFETLTAPQAVVWFALALGVAFGALAQITRFCLRRSLVGEDRKQAAGVWLTALAVAVLGTQAAVAQALLRGEAQGGKAHGAWLGLTAAHTSTNMAQVRRRRVRGGGAARATDTSHHRHSGRDTPIAL